MSFVSSPLCLRSSTSLNTTRNDPQGKAIRCRFGNGEASDHRGSQRCQPLPDAVTFKEAKGAWKNRAEFEENSPTWEKLQFCVGMIPLTHRHIIKANGGGSCSSSLKMDVPRNQLNCIHRNPKCLFDTQNDHVCSCSCLSTKVLQRKIAYGKFHQSCILSPGFWLKMSSPSSNTKSGDSGGELLVLTSRCSFNPPWP